MSKIDIQTTLEIDDYELDERIVRSAADSLLERFAIHQSREKAIEAIDAAIAERAKAAVDKVFDAGFQPVDSLGNPRGERRPGEDYIADALASWLGDRVDRDGKLTKPSYAAFTRGEYLVKHFATHGLVTIAEKEIRALRESAKREISATIANTVVKSLGGQK